MERERPVCALDVDGVISLFGFEGPPEQAPGRFRLINGIAHCIAHGVGDRINRLAERFEIVWATGWEERANEALPQLLGLAGELPYLTFNGQARFGTAHWKIDPIGDYAADRPLAWIDDCLDESCRAWAASREAPTLLVRTEPSTGLTDELTDRILRWAEAGYTQAE
jgi:hypothetical protein